MYAPFEGRRQASMKVSCGQWSCWVTLHYMRSFQRNQRNQRRGCFVDLVLQGLCVVSSMSEGFPLWVVGRPPRCVETVLSYAGLMGMFPPPPPPAPPLPAPPLALAVPRRPNRPAPAPARRRRQPQPAALFFSWNKGTMYFSKGKFYRSYESSSSPTIFLGEFPKWVFGGWKKPWQVFTDRDLNRGPFELIVSGKVSPTEGAWPFSVHGLSFAYSLGWSFTRWLLTG